MRRSILLFVLLAILLGAWLASTKHPQIREYRLYLIEDRPPAQLNWQQLSESWTPSQVQKQFSGNYVQCYPDDSGHPGVSFRCSVDLKSLNGVPTMYMNYWFAHGRLVRAASAIPWWSHENAKQYLTTMLGPPHTTQDQPVNDIRLIGWRLPEGHVIVYNRDQDRNPLEPSSVQWLSPTACKGQPCIH